MTQTLFLICRLREGKLLNYVITGGAMIQTKVYVIPEPLLLITA